MKLAAKPTVDLHRKIIVLATRYRLLRVIIKLNLN